MSEIIEMPAIIIKDVALLPGMTVNFSVINPEASAECEEAMRGKQLVFVASQIVDTKKPTMETLLAVGMVTHIRQITKLPNHSISLMLESVSRGKIMQIMNPRGTKMAVEMVEDVIEIDRYENEAMLRTLRELFIEYVSINNKTSNSPAKDFNMIDNLGLLTDIIAGTSPLPVSVKLELLQNVDVRSRYDRLVKVLKDEIEVNRIQADLKKQVSEKISKSQHDYFLREQLSSIKKELGEDAASEELEYEKEFSLLCASEEVKEKIKKEIGKLDNLNQGGSEASVQRGYIETLLELPWDRMSEDNTDIKHARMILDRDHYGLLKVKERVLEFLAVRTLNSKGESPIICLVGPPGTGKTSIAKSIAEALNKKYVRICLGGVKDEAEIRGHRRTYVGAMPGNIVAGLKQAGVKNPLMLLDEIDKASGTYKGDTSSALLEVLDSEQNAHFKDHYVGIPVDLSEVLFIATANSAADIPRPLYDRMEIIEVSSYTANEKYHIAKNYLVKKQLKKNGLSTKQVNISDSAIKCMIGSYTKEAGVRELERKIGEVCRKAAIDILENGTTKVSVTGKNLSKFLGKEKYHDDQIQKKDEIGIVRGLAWTPVGGTTLSVEVNCMPGKGEIDLTGQMGDVMKESAHAGLSFIRSIADEYGIKPEFFKEHDIHIHIPEGAVPKDGPSAGITMATAVVSAITGIPVRRDVAMTGEITLRGRVLPIGGLKEKTLAAKTAGVKKIILPQDNQADWDEISDEIKDGMEFVFVDNMTQVLKEALTKQNT